jgi:hypothetical protein
MVSTHIGYAITIYHYSLYHDVLNSGTSERQQAWLRHFDTISFPHTAPSGFENRYGDRRPPA